LGGREETTGFEVDATDFTAANVTTFTAKCQEYNELKDAAKDEDASKPDALKKLTGWALWKIHSRTIFARS
jgi:hypothetical protein